MEAQLPGDVFGPDVFAVRLQRCHKYGPGRRLRTNVKFENRTTGTTYTLNASLGKNRFWLRVKINGKLWHVGRLVAWCFGNPRRLTWATFAKRNSSNYVYQARHVSLDETDFRAENLLIGTRLQNLEQYRREASDKYNKVKRP